MIVVVSGEWLFDMSHSMHNICFPTSPDFMTTNNRLTLHEEDFGITVSDVISYGLSHTNYRKSQNTIWGFGTNQTVKQVMIGESLVNADPVDTVKIENKKRRNGSLWINKLLTAVLFSEEKKWSISPYIVISHITSLLSVPWTSLTMSLAKYTLGPCSFRRTNCIPPTPT